MKFIEFKIKNFKGIEDVTVNLDKSPDANIYTLVGLNESGKTSILEAINLFKPDNSGLNALELPGATIKDNNILIPISKRDNFNDTITIEVSFKLDLKDLEKINEHLNEKSQFKQVKNKEFLKYYRHYRFKDSKFQKLDSKWDGFSGWLKTEQEEKYVNIDEKSYPDENILLASFCRNLIPSILYFPNFLFDFPSKIYLNTEIEAKEKFYIELIQDILFSLENNLNIQTHLVERIESSDANDKRNLNSLLLKMSNKVTGVVFDAWNRIFKREIRDTRVVIKSEIDEDGLPYLEFEIEAQDGIYQINERSLGFRWFFVFLLFTQFRPFRKNTPQNIIYLFDEPASNLHSSAQKQLLESFETLTKNKSSKIIYTTHSHHLINPNWLESTYVVKNEGLELENPESYNVKKTNITIEPYREFAVNHPHNTAYFQPILDVLDYSPSNLEIISKCVLMEGKNDFYTIAYFQEVILSKSKKLNLAPSTGSGNLDTLISLYIGWAKDFIVFLDSDNEGNKQKQRYIDKFGIIIESKIFTFEDIDQKWKNFKMEDLFEKAEALNFQNTAYPSSIKLNKTHFNRTIQEFLINKNGFSFSEQTKQNFEKILTFFDTKLSQ